MPEMHLGQRVERLQQLARSPWLRNTLGEAGSELVDELVAVVADLVTLATAPLTFIAPPPLPFARPRAVEGGPACPATAEARFDALLMELTGDGPATPPTPAEAGK